MAGKWRSSQLIYDCFMLAGELDILECRLATLEPYDVTHVIVEAGTDNHGNPKPYSLDGGLDYYGRFHRWRSRIIYVKTNGMPGPSAWEREHQQRDIAMSVLRTRAQPGDPVIVADVDEIPSETAMAVAAQAVSPWCLMMRNIMLTLDQAMPELLPTSVIVPWQPSVTLSQSRDIRHLFPTVNHAGWHLSWLGGPEAFERKLAMHCHSRQETDAMTARLMLNDDVPPWCRDHAPAAWWSNQMGER